MDKPKPRTRAVKKPDNVIINDDELFPTKKKGKGANNMSDMFNEAIITTSTKHTTTTTNTNTNPKSNSKKPDNNSDNDEDNNSENGFKKNGYTRPEVTYTDQLSKEQIEKKLEDYKKANNLNE